MALWRTKTPDMKIVWALPFCLVLVVAQSHLAQEAKAQQSVNNRAEVQLGSSWTIGNSQAPLIKLASALRENAKARRFRVSWSFVIGPSGASSTVLYDRDHRVLKLYSKHNNQHGARVSHYGFLPVTDEAIHKLAQKYQDNDAAMGHYDELAFFTHLTEFGAMKRDLSGPWKPQPPVAATKMPAKSAPIFTAQQKENWLDIFANFLAKEADDDLNPPATQQSIQQLENALGQQKRIRGFKFPSSYQAFLLRYDGGLVNWEGPPESRDDVNADDGAAYIHFLRVAEDKKYRMSLMNYNGADTVFMNHEIETYFPFEPLVMFASDEGGNFWAFDPRHKRADGEMPVRFCDHETGDIYAQVEDFPSFMLAFSTHVLRYRGIEDPLPRAPPTPKKKR
jgi:hypothetical protein